LVRTDLAAHVDLFERRCRPVHAWLPGVWWPQATVSVQRASTARPGQARAAGPLAYAGAVMSRVVLVTGCSSGIGLGLAREVTRRGERCFASARRAESVAALRAEGLEALRLDVNDPASIREAVGHVEAQAGRIDLLVNNAGTSLFGPLAELPL